MVRIQVEEQSGSDAIRFVVAGVINQLLGEEIAGQCRVLIPDVTFEVLAPDESWVEKLQARFPGAVVELAS